jgi:argininosuccinate lyase
LVRALGISFRQAHQIVALAVRRVIESGKDAAALDVAILRDAASSIGGLREWDLSDERLGRALDPDALVRSRVTTGSAQPDEVRRMIARGREALERDGTWVRAGRDALHGADRELREESARVSS